MEIQKNQNNDHTVLDHILELRTRILISILTVILGSGIAHFFHKQIIEIILKPLDAQKLIFLSPLDPLFFILKIDLVGGVLFALPIIVWSILSYIKPILTKKTNYLIFLLYTSSTFLLLTALIYTYFVVIPIILKFLNSITISGIESTITAQNYLGFFIMQILIIALIFQIPLFIVLGIYMKIFNTKLLSTKRGYIYVAITVALAVLTPTSDVFSLSIILVPALIIFEISLIIGKIVERFRK